MIYFDNAATSFPKPTAVGDAMARFLTDAAANPGRSGYRMAIDVERRLDALRLRLTRLVGGDDPSRLIFAFNGTDALNMAIKGVLDTLPGQPHVITTELEHNSVLRPLQARADANRITLTLVEGDDQGFVDPLHVANALTDATRLVVMTHASNVTGTIQNIAQVGQTVRDHGALFCVDAAQTLGLVPMDVSAMAVDLLAFPGHKALLGPTGTGGLYVGSRVKTIAPWREGGTGEDSASPTQPTQWPAQLEAGTPNTAGLIGLAAALDQEVPRDLSHEQLLRRLLVDALQDDDRFVLLGPRDSQRCVGTLSFNVQGMDSADVAAILDQSFGIAVRSGLHCAPQIHRRLGTFPHGAVRVSAGRFNTEAQVDQLIDALKQIAG